MSADPIDPVLLSRRVIAGGELTRDEAASMALLLLVAGHETTANMIGLGTLTLLRDAGQAAQVRDGSPEVVNAAVEELLGDDTRVSFLYGVAVGTAISVALTMIASLTLLPAVLSLLGLRVLPRKARRAMRAGTYAYDVHGYATKDGLRSDPASIDFGQVPVGGKVTLS